MAQVESTPARIPVLIVDDHLMFAESLGRLLAGEPDFEVLGTARTAAAARDLIAVRAPRVMLVDYNLPDADGTELAAEVKRTNPDVMIVMVTASTEDRVLVAAIDAGCSGFLTKDRASNEVTEAVRAAASGEVIIPPALLARLLPRLNRSFRGLGSDLTQRELEVLDLLAKGMTNRAVADELSLSVNTVRNHVAQILAKLDTHSKLEAVATAVREGLIRYPSA